MTATKPKPHARMTLPESRLQRLTADGLVEIVGNTIKYLRVGHQDVVSDPEEQVRADLYLDLIEQYQYADPSAIAMEKLHKIGHPYKKSDAKIDLLVKNPDGSPFMIFELKSPAEYESYLESSVKTQLFNVAAVENQGHGTLKYLVYYTRWWEGSDLKEKLLCIDYAKYSTFQAWDDNARPNLRAIPADYARVRVPTYVKAGPLDLSTNVGRDELQRVRKDLHNILWGGGKYQNELFFNLVGLFLAKIYDEKETEDGRPYDFQVFFEDETPEPAQKVYARMNAMYLRALREYLGYSKAEMAKIRDIVFDAPKVRYVVEVLQGISFTTNTFDVIGDFFEGIVRGEFKQSKGQYLTHTNIIRFIVRALGIGEMALTLVNDAKRLPFIVDPACGSGAFLIESMREVTDYVASHPSDVKKSDAVQEFVKGAFPEFRQNAWAREYIFGLEVNGDLAAAAKVNMVGHGDGSANIEARDALLPWKDFASPVLKVTKRGGPYPKPVNEQFDVVVSNPPFSVTVDRDTAKTFPASFVRGDAIIKTLAKSKQLEVATELLFIERYYQLLRARGRLAVVLPESVFDAGSTRDTRLFLFKHFWVRAVVSLPSEAFAPYTTTKTNILFAEKKTPEQVDGWETAWRSYADAYRSLKLELDGFVQQPELVKRVHEVVKAFNEAMPGISPEGAEGIAADRALAAVGESGGGDSLHDTVGDAVRAAVSPPEGQARAKLDDIIRRKRSLGTSAERLAERTRKTGRFVALLRELLGDFFDEDHARYSREQLIKEYTEEIRYADADWWVFKRVSSELCGDDPIFLAHADELGYKRGIRGEDNRPNELYTEQAGAIVVGDASDVVLDQLVKTVSWTPPSEE